MEEFTQDIVDLSQYRVKRILRTGSSIEAPVTSPTFEIFNLKMNQLDSDLMFFTNDCLALPPGVRVPGKYRGKVFRISSTDMHPGYVQLIDEDDGGNVTFLKRHPSLFLGKNVAGPAIQMDVVGEHRSIASKYTLSELGEDPFFGHENVIFFNKRDYVRAIHCPYWPEEASEWVTRSRSHGFPSSSLIRQIDQGGCDFVHVAHKASGVDETQWRFSFSRAELVITRNWTGPQRVVYRALRLLFKVSENEENAVKYKALSSYCFKTLMLWACEEKEPDFWQCKFLRAIFFLLDKMIGWVKEKNCPNYFMPNNNMMDHLLSVNLHDDLEALEVLVFRICSETADSRLIIDVCTSEMQYNDFKLQLILPKWIHRILLITDRMCNGVDLFSHLCPSVKRDTIFAKSYL